MTFEEKRIQKVKHQLMDYSYYKAVERELEAKIKDLVVEEFERYLQNYVAVPVIIIGSSRLSVNKTL